MDREDASFEENEAIRTLVAKKAQQFLGGGDSVMAVDGLDNHFELVLPSNVTSVQLVASIRPQANPTENMDLRYGVADGSGLDGYGTHGVRIIRVATGDVQVSVVWDAPTDVEAPASNVPLPERVIEVLSKLGQGVKSSGVDASAGPACTECAAWVPAALDALSAPTSA